MRRRVPAKIHTGRPFRKILPAAAILLAGILAILGLPVYKIIHPGAVPEAVDPSHYLLPSLSEPLPTQALSDRTILFIRGENRKGLESMTAAVYDKILPQKEMISLKAARVHMMSGDDLRRYDSQVAGFFQLNLK